MNKEITQTGAALFISAVTTWMTAKHYYLSDIDKKFDLVRSDICDIKSNINTIRVEIDRKYDKIDNKLDYFYSDLNVILRELK